MLTFGQLQEKKTKVKINPKKDDLMETPKKKHPEDCACSKCEDKEDKEGPTVESWKPEIEHIKGSDLRKKAAEKKRKEAESSLPPHLKLDAMKKAFAHTNEGVADTVLSGTYHQIKTGAKRHKDAVEKKKIKNRKAVPYAALAAEHQPEGEMIEHHQKDKDGKVIEHEDTTPCSVEEELSRRSKPSAKAKMAKLDAVLKRREERKVKEKEALKTEGWLGKKKEEKKPEKAMDAGARAKRKLQRREYASKISGSEDNVPDEMREGVVGRVAKAAAKGAGKAVGFAAKALSQNIDQTTKSLSNPDLKPKIDMSSKKKEGGASAAKTQADKAHKARVDARKKAIKKIKDDRRERASKAMTADKAANKVKKEAEDKKFKADSEKPIVAEFVDHLWEASKKKKKKGCDK